MEAEPQDDAFRLDDPGIGVVFHRADGEKCQRCWKILPDVGHATPASRGPTRAFADKCGKAGFSAQRPARPVDGGDPWDGRSRVRDMAAGFFADVPDLSLTCDDIRLSGRHVVYVWTFTGHDAGTGNPLSVRGWEEWDLGPDLKVQASRGWFDADDYARQAAGG
jgi:hypothetical protein